MAANKNICKCPRPPGGTATCEQNQLAICRIVDGQPVAECINPPPFVESEAHFATRAPLQPSADPAFWSQNIPVVVSAQRVANWVLACAIQESRPALAPIDLYRMQFLRSGIESEETLSSEELVGYLGKIRFRPSQQIGAAIRVWASAVGRQYPFLSNSGGWAVNEGDFVAHSSHQYRGPEIFDPDVERDNYP